MKIDVGKIALVAVMIAGIDVYKRQGQTFQPGAHIQLGKVDAAGNERKARNDEEHGADIPRLVLRLSLIHIFADHRDASVIVGYYTSAEVPSPRRRQPGVPFVRAFCAANLHRPQAM